MGEGLSTNIQIFVTSFLNNPLQVLFIICTGSNLQNFRTAKKLLKWFMICSIILAAEFSILLSEINEAYKTNTANNEVYLYAL